MGNMNVTVIDQNNVNIAVTPTPTQTINIDRGIIGVSGLSGYSGYSGYSGIGSSGYSGLSGFSGYSGISGWSGESGYSGWSGESGYSGDSGISGYSGFSGYSGDSGISGFSGDSGISGYSGESGISGYSGFSGQQGTSINVKGEVPTVGDLPPTGNQVNDAYIVTEDGNLWVWNGSAWYDAGQIVGPQGLSGFSGYSGESGYSGFSGDSGISGWSGESGISGFSGDSGISGWSGFSGESGYSGLNGDSGYSGISGYSGFSGDSGISGWSGISGYSGSGISGWSGFSGYSGISGQDGASGFSGYSGISGYSGSGISGYSGYSGIGTSGYSGFSGYSGYSGAVGAGGAIGNWGSFWDTTTQTTTINTPTAITFNSYDVDSTGVSIGSPTSRIVFANSGTYSLTFSIQFTNTSTANGATQIWLKKNGTNIPDTNSHFDVPDKQGSAFSSEILTVNFVFNVTANDYVQLYWDTTNASVSLETIAGNGTYPRTPSVIFTATQVMYGQSGYSGISGYSGYSGFSGISGFSGESGISGYSGSGVSGWSGASGYSGYSGEVGTSGYSGYSGISGTNGASGFSGISGYSGYSGIDGASGFSGYSGISGYSGSGVSGYSGFSGISGYSGYSGITPAIGGSNTQVQFNNSGVLGGSANLVFNGTQLTSGGLISTGALNVSGGGWSVLPYAFNSLTIDNASGSARFFATGANSSTYGSYIWYGGLTTGATSEYMTLDTNGRLGIGTSIPYGLLNIKGTNGQLVLANGNTSGGMKITATDVNYTANGYLAFEGYANEYGRFDSSGRLGIGTSSPARILELKASQSAMVFNDNTNQWTIGTGSFIDGSDNFIFYKNAVGDLMRLTGSGNLGLGVTPASFATVKAIQLNTASTLMAFTNEFDIGQNVYYNAGNRYITTGLASMYAQTTGQHQWFIAPSGTAGNAISFTQAMTLDASGNLGVGTTSPSTYGKLVVNGAIYSIGGNAVGVGNSDNTNFSYLINSGSTGSNNANMTFNMTNKGELMRLTSDGYLGIGTTSPSYKLQVMGTIYANNSTNVAYLMQGSQYGGSFANTSTANTYSLGYSTDGSTQTSVLYWNASGRVGIGTISPNVKFEVGATTTTGAEISAYTTSTAGGDSSKFSFWRNYTNGSSAPFRAAYISNINSDDSFNGSNAQFLGFFTKSGTAEPVERMRIDSSGNLALGISGGYRTAASYTALAINGTVGALIDLYASGTRHGGMAATSAGTYVSSITAIPLIFSTTDIERMRLDSVGRVGFGTQGTTADRLVDMAFAGATTTGANQFGLVLNPTYPNTVSSSLFNAFLATTVTSGATFTNLFTLYLAASNTTGSTVTNKYGLYQAGANDKNYFEGNVGIGTTTPTTKLQVAGTVTATEYSSGLSGTTSSLAPTASETILTVANYSMYLVYGGGTSNTSAMGMGIAQCNGGGGVTVTQLSGAATGFTLSASGNNIQITNNTATQSYRWKAVQLVNLN